MKRSLLLVLLLPIALLAAIGCSGDDLTNYYYETYETDGDALCIEITYPTSGDTVPEVFVATISFPPQLPVGWVELRNSLNNDRVSMDRYWYNSEDSGKNMSRKALINKCLFLLVLSSTFNHLPQATTVVWLR